MPALTALSCTGFCLPSFPGKDTRLVALHRLTLSDNCIAELPARIDLVVPNVSELVLDRNCLMALPTGFSGLTPLRRLDLAHNNISEVRCCYDADTDAL
jgi:Leucine-rich repeat (LRR) protein